MSLMNPSISVDIEILRDCYESFAMYCFGRYLTACLGMTSEFLSLEELIMTFLVVVYFLKFIIHFGLFLAHWCRKHY